ncbi:MAG: hypothetical protein Q4F10_06995 [Corynebacterium glutamicum]|nr:hypothetical protein [Corynebacterium glutamicum]
MKYSHTRLAPITSRNANEITRMHQELAAANQTPTKLIARNEKQLTAKETENLRPSKAADALGKAITVLQEFGDSVRNVYFVAVW